MSFNRQDFRTEYRRPEGGLKGESGYKLCPHCNGGNTGYWRIDEETEWFTTVVPNDKGFDLYACSDGNRMQCIHLNRN